jgi:DNA polymerase-1
MYILIDGNGILCRYIFAMKEQFYDSDGFIVSGVYGFCRLILKLMREDIRGIYIAFDKCKNNFRKLIDPTYKSNRIRSELNIWAQVDRTIEFCKLANIPFCFSDIYEGDDIINSITSQNPDINFRIIATDKDFYQIVSEKVQVFQPFKKEMISVDTVIQKYGIPPNKFTLFLTLCGDASDNIQGIRGIGPKGAAKILQNVENLEQLKCLLPEHSSTLDIMHSLVKLYPNVLIDPPLRDLSINKTEVRRFLQYMNFNSLMHLV